MFDVPVNPIAVISTLSVLLVVAMVIEFPTQKIPNWLTGTSVIAGFALAVIDQQWALHFYGFLSGFMIGFFIFVKGYASAGFIKLLIGVSTILGTFVPLLSLGVGMILIGFGYIYSHFKSFPETEEEQDRRRGLLPGSVYLTLMSVLALLLLYRPWEKS